jgi:hypothetical protein
MTTEQNIIKKERLAEDQEDIQYKAEKDYLSKYRGIWKGIV